MKLRLRILLIFLGVGVAITLITGILYYYSARKIILLAAGNQLESLSSAKKLRIEGIIREREASLRLVQRRFFNASNLHQLNKYGHLSDSLKINYRALVDKNIKQITTEMHQFIAVHILDRNGVAIASTDSGSINFNFGVIEFVQKALEGENVVSSILDRKHSSSDLCLSGPLLFDGKLQGAILIETSTTDLTTITGDYTGLGSTGETVIAQSITDTLACYITPTRYGQDKSNVFLLNPKDTQAVFLALSGKENLMLDALDNDGEKVATSFRYIPQTGWAVITKMNLDELLEATEQIKWMIIKIGSGTLLGLFAISLLLAGSIVRPIKRISKTAKLISEGNWEQRVKVDSNNELGELAVSFNKMTDSLIDAQDKLNEKVEQLDKSNESLEKFAFVISHDLKSPLNSVLGIIELLETESLGNLSDDGKHMLKLLKYRIEHMKQMIAGILQFARLNSSSGQEQQITNLNDLIKNISNTYQNNIDINIVEPLPQVAISPILAEQLFQNLISNAIKYNNSPQKVIKIGLKTSEKEQVFYVSDNGIGIAANDIGKIFGIFQTLAPRSEGSHGIGLAIVKKIVESYSGKIWVESLPNEGSIFYFTLPDALVKATSKKIPVETGTY